MVDYAAPAVPSPCVRNCCLDDADVCIGCGRALQEIMVWSTSTDAEKVEIVARSRTRLAQRQERTGRR